MLRLVIAALLAASLGACTTIDTGSKWGNALYFGLVRVDSPNVAANSAVQTSTPMSALDARIFGLRFQGGVTIGYIHDQRYEIPMDCRVVIFVQNQAQLDYVTREFAGFKEGVCSTIKQL